MNLRNYHTVPKRPGDLIFSEGPRNVFIKYFLGLLLFSIPREPRGLGRISWNILRTSFVHLRAQRDPEVKLSCSCTPGKNYIDRSSPNNDQSETQRQVLAAVPYIP